MRNTSAGEETTQIFGKLEEDYTHTVIKVVQNGQNVNYTLYGTKFDRDKSDRDFLDAEEISSDIFEEQLRMAKS